MSNFWISLDLVLINYEIGLDIKWTKNCVIYAISRTFRAIGDPTGQEVATTTTEARFQIANVKLYGLVVTFLINGNINFLKNIKQVLKRTISWSKYRSETIAQLKNNNSDYLIDPTIRRV